MPRTLLDTIKIRLEQLDDAADRLEFSQFNKAVGPCSNSPLPDHIKGLVYANLSAGVTWETTVKPKLPAVDKLF
jgi:hypothetical protein